VRDRCPEATYGQHGEPSTTGRCPYCGQKVGPRYNRSGGDGRVSMGHRGSITHEEEQYLDSRRMHVNSITRTTEVFADQDPLRYVDAEEEPYD
jgi:hypothetical protein